MGSISLSIFTSSSEPPVYIPTLNKVEPFGELQGIPTALEDIQLLLDQWSEAHDLWQAIFTIGRAEVSPIPCRKGMTGPFKSNDKGWRGGPINSTYAIIDPNRSSNYAHTTTPSDYARCVS
ncbi:hypothetical protein Goshw_008615 [Gossypium schwendimanii]|uniref:Uncharacterized protein n=1 Tax=Gossypium schwendimanii TaxID=34291 RepID=A0A7J9MBE2_GOSSC|nr:hypothetical protein [Gossypium schwendimanii]